MNATPEQERATAACTEARRALVRGLRAPGTLAELERTPFFASCRVELETLLGSAEVVPHPSARPRVGAFIRVAQWNIEQGRAFDRIRRALEEDPVLRAADIVLLNEADHGMSRSGNRHVARELAATLGMHLAFAPAHVELTAGTDDRAGEENGASLQGNAVLARYPIVEARAVPLPAVFEPYHFHEKRYGRRNCVWARLRMPRGDWWVGSAHLEVRETPAARRRQAEHLLAQLPGTATEPHLLGGDLNTNGFARGTRWRTLGSAARLILGPAGRVKAELLRPDVGREPLFEAFARAGFEWRALNGAGPTAVVALDDVEDAALLPGWLRAGIRMRLAAYDGALEMKLDWLLGRGVRPLAAREVDDPAAGFGTLGAAACGPLPRLNAARASDHVPIYADLAL